MLDQPLELRQRRQDFPKRRVEHRLSRVPDSDARDLLEILGDPDHQAPEDRSTLPEGTLGPGLLSGVGFEDFGVDGQDGVGGEG